MSYPIEGLENWELAYIAGIIDGEGCISLHADRNNIRPVVTVEMASVECVNLLYTLTGVGSFRLEKRHQPKHYKQRYRWEVGSRLEIYLLLKALQPYLVVKRKHATLMLEFVDRRIQEKLFTERDVELQTEIHKLNS